MEEAKNKPNIKTVTGGGQQNNAIIADLQRIWEKCFPDGCLDDADERNRAARHWEAQRGQHLPKTLELLRSSQINIRYKPSSAAANKSQRALALMSGYSPEQLALVVALHYSVGCRYVVPFTGEGLWNNVQQDVAQCLKEMDIDPDDVLKDPIEVESGNPADIFKKLSKWLKSHKDFDIAVDCTGGKKPMDSGASYAASFFELPAYYVDFDDYDPKLRRPLPWSCHYVQLPHPDTVFSLSSRNRIVEAYKNYNFDLAQAALRVLIAATEREKILANEDREQLEDAYKILELDSAWWNVRYQHIRSHELHDLWEGAKTKAPRDFVNLLLKAEDFGLLFRYLVDEYWRLYMLGEIGQSREALVGMVGICELAIDSLLMGGSSIEVVVNKFKIITPANISESLEHWKDIVLPKSFIPKSCQQQKINLLRKGETKLELWVHPDIEPRKAFKEPAPSNDSNNWKLSVNARIKNDLKPLYVDKTIWSQLFGNYYQGSWIDNRHALAHMRAPLVSESAIKEVDDACKIYAPRFLEILWRVHNGRELDLANAGNEDWITWWLEERWSREHCFPSKENQLRRLLNLV